MSTRTLPRYEGRISNYCWAEHSSKGLRCTMPHGHHGPHWHPYTKTSW